MVELQKHLLEKFLHKYGEDEQLRQAMGECGELIAACQNYHRAKKFGYKKEDLEKVIEEAVDVYFMIQQVRFLNPFMFDLYCNSKYQKVLDKFNNET